MDHLIFKTLRVFICAVFIIQLTGCGTLLYPERKGQRAGKIDAGVAILDGIGLLLFIVPGVIAFAVDFNNGTIYLPGTSRSSFDAKNIKEVKFNAQHSTLSSIEKIIKQQTGQVIVLDKKEVSITALQSKDDMLEQFAALQLDNQYDKIALRK